MLKLIIEGVGIFDVKEGIKLVLVIEDSGVNIFYCCGGNVCCIICRVEILVGDFCEVSVNEKYVMMEKGIEDYL